MRKLKTWVLSLIVLSCLTGVASPVSDTLLSSQNDRVIVHYELVEKDGTVEIRFIKVNKKLSKNHGEVYGDDLSYVKVMCFDREYDFKDIIIKGGLCPKLFMIPDNELVYSPSDDGYFIIDDGPVLRFEGQLSKPTTLSIPLFLAYYKDRLIKKKRPYELFAYCGNLEIKIGQNQIAPILSAPQDAINKTEHQEILVPEGDELIEEEDPALLAIEGDALAGAIYVMEELGNRRPNVESLSKQVEDLKKIKHQIQNEEIISKIETTLKAYGRYIDSIEKEQEKENKRMDSSAFAQCTTIEACDAYLSTYPNGGYVEEVRQKKDTLQTDKDRIDKRNKIMMIVGGVLLAILMLVGNQVMQSIRENKMEKKRQDALDKAQEKAQQQQQQLLQQANGETQSKKQYTI